MITLQQLQQYRDDPAYSQSELKSLLSGKSHTKKPSLTMLLGSYLDCALLTPHLIDDLYWVVDVQRPTDKIVELCDSLLSWVISWEVTPDLSENLSDHEETIQHWIETVEYYSNRPKTRVEKFIKEAKDWWSFLVQKGDRQIITSVEEVEADLINIRLTQDSALDWIWDAQFQKDFYWEEQGVLCKGLGDIYRDDVYVDIKYTTCDTLQEWYKVCVNLNYAFQMAFYKSGLNAKACHWLVINKNWHQVVPVSDLLLNIGKWGYDKKETIRVGKVETDLWKHTDGYLDGLNLINGQIRTKTIESIL